MRPRSAGPLTQLIFGSFLLLAQAACSGSHVDPPFAATNGSTNGSTNGAPNGSTNGAPNDASQPPATNGSTGLEAGVTATSGASGAPLDSGMDGMQDAGDPVTSPSDIATSTRSPQTQAWWSYERAPSHEWVMADIMVPMRDGTKLGCTLVRPATGGSAAPGQFPGLVVDFTPYTAEAFIFNIEAQFFAERGYNALVCTVRGTGRSEDDWHNAFAPTDSQDAHDLVEWLAVQPFSDGRIGQFGESYGGQTTYGSAIEQAPHLKAIAPMQPPASLYHDVIYPGGIETTQGGTMNNWPEIAVLATGFAVDPAEEYAVGAAHPTFDDFWAERSFHGLHSRIQVPILTIGSWFDEFFRSGTMINIEGALERTWVIYGPWGHLPVVDLNICAFVCVEDPLPSGVLLAWFDHWVMELDDMPIPSEPTFVSFEGPKDAGGKGWLELSHWDPEGANAVTFELGSDGAMVETAAPSGPLTFSQPGEPTENGAALTFTTAALESSRVLLGWATLSFRARLKAPDAHFYVELIDVDAAGEEAFVNNGFLKASHRMSHVTPQPVPVNEATEFEVRIRAQHYRFAAGHRVLLRVSGGDSKMLVQAAPVEIEFEAGSSATLRMPGFAAERTTRVR